MVNQPKLFGADPNYTFIAPDAQQQEKDIRTALIEAIAKKRANPDYFQKQIDGVLPPKAIISPEHYHLSYVYDGRTYPHMEKKYKKSRQAYLEIWRVSSLSVRYGEPIYWDDKPAVTIWTPLKGRTGVHQVFIEVVECLIPRCGEYPTVMAPAVPDNDGDIRV